MSAVALTDIPTGFAAPARDSQHCFRQLLTATSYPGRLETINLSGFDRPAGLSSAAAAFLTALPDPSTSVWLSRSLYLDPSLSDYIRFHTGCERFSTEAPQTDHLGWVSQDDLLSVELEDFYSGTDLEPYSSTTLVLDVRAFGRQESTGQKQALLRLRGPGIKSDTTLVVSGLSSSFWRQRVDQQRRFPCGVDLVLTHADTLLALPRTTHIEVIQCT